MDFFDILLAKKLEDDRDPTIEGLSVTENGIYSEPGKAYSPVIVEVPEPTLISKTITANGTYSASADNADGYSSVTVAVDGFKKKSIANTPTDIASFADGTANPMPSLEISINPVQSGSGDPSPSNVRPISGWSGANVTVADDLTTPTETHTTTIPFHDSSDNPITVYGGTLNVTSGELRVTHGYVDLGTLNWEENSTYPALFNGQILVESTKVSTVRHICSIFIATDSTSVIDLNNSIAISASGKTVYAHDDSYETAAAFKTAMNGVQLVYELATPQTYQLTPTQVATLLGQNNIFADCGQILDGEYFVTL